MANPTEKPHIDESQPSPTSTANLKNEQSNSAPAASSQDVNGSTKPAAPSVQWNANYIPPPVTPEKLRQTPLGGLPSETRSPAELLRRLSLSVPSAPTPDDDDFDPRVTFPELQLSGNVITATFCVPHKIGYSANGEWTFEPRPGTSALFDSFSYLASPQSGWKLTLVGWTGEIKRLPDRASEMPLADLPTAPATVPADSYKIPNQTPESGAIRIPVEHQRALEKMLAQDLGGCVEPVWLPDSCDKDGTISLQDQSKWRRYGEHELFTLFHYKQNKPSDGRASQKSYADYVKMNQAFADAIFAVYKPGDVVLIHDYQLALLPKLLRQRVPAMYIGFFLHVPFPTSEHYRCLPQREPILQGMLGANMIGFQTFGYLRHFSSCCSRLLGTESSSASVDYDGAHSAIAVLPIGINAVATLQSAFGSPDIEDELAALRSEYVGVKVIVGRDRLDSVRGVVQKLQGFEKFLQTYPEWHHRVVLIQVTSPTSIEDREDKSDHTESKISDLISRINGRFGTLRFAPVHYHPQYLTKEQYFSLLRIADVGLITSTRDGMNTTALEYVLCQRDNHSPLIISEFSGTASSLSDAIQINPWHLKMVACAIERALTMSAEEKKETHQKLYQFVKDHTVQDWTRGFLKRLLTNLTAFDQGKTTPLLDTDALLKRYRDSSRRLFMFDYDGTLTPIVKDPDQAIPSDKVIRTLKALAANPNNAVWIISGRDQNFLNEWMGHITNLGLSAEHGSFMREPGTMDWDNLTEKFDMGWQEKAMEVFQRYTDITKGSFIERKKIALTWHYRRADPVQGPYNAHKCQRELDHLVTPHWDVEVMTGKANLEVRPKFVNKGEIAKKLVDTYGAGVGVEPDFVLCLGDDSTDEDMFRSLRASQLNTDHVFAVTIGLSGKQTLARWHLPDPSHVVAAIEQLNKSDAESTRGD